jgi:zinc/manganese transport system permease protein
LADALSLLWLPFTVAACLVAIHTYFGVQVLARNIVFVDLALAQIAALGATVAFMLGHSPQGTASHAYSFAFTLAAALLLAFTRQWSRRIPQEALIGVIYVVAAAGAFLLVDRAPQGAEHIKQILTGNILTVGMDDLLLIAPVYAVIGTVHAIAGKWFATATTGAALWWRDFVFYASFGLVVTSSVPLAGVLLVFSFLIIPAAIGMLWSQRLSRQLAIGWSAGCLASAAGLAASYAWDLPTGASMVCAFGTTLAMAGVARSLGGSSSRKRTAVARTASVAFAFVFVVSGAWLAIAPRADQPLIDSAEYFAPGLRSAYMREAELEIWRDADEHADRYLRELEKLNDREAQTRWQGKTLDDAEVRKISSFLKSYSEMRKGEQFVMREVRSRARERERWKIGVAMVLLGCAALPFAFPRNGVNQSGRRDVT